MFNSLQISLTRFPSADARSAFSIAASLILVLFMAMSYLKIECADSKGHYTASFDTK